MWMAAGDQHAVKLQLSGLFAELRDKMEEEMVKCSEIKMKNDKQNNTESIVELSNAKTINIFMQQNNIYRIREIHFS